MRKNLDKLFYLFENYLAPLNMRKNISIFRFFASSVHQVRQKLNKYSINATLKYIKG